MNLLHSCRQVAELLSRGLDEPLGWLDRLRLRMHLSMCGNCRNVERQLDAMHAMTADLFAPDDEPAAADDQDLPPPPAGHR